MVKKVRKTTTEIAETESRRLTMVDRDRITEALAAQSIRNNSLREEIIFILQQRFSEANIKVHEIEGRVKKIESVLAKCERKGSRDHNTLTDVVGARVVCLFRSDMSRVAEVLKANFEIVSVDDKLSEAGPLGYQSTHYICKLPNRYKGPRYENTAGVEFEVQARTLCMHAWAAVSHHLDYKGDWDVPQELKQALSALGGLFYVADNQFEQFYSARIQSELEAAKKPNVDEVQEINLDTMKSYLERKFPSRKHGYAGICFLFS
jgi:putative GTP pyrophosphokinase